MLVFSKATAFPTNLNNIYYGLRYQLISSKIKTHNLQVLFMSVYSFWQHWFDAFDNITVSVFLQLEALQLMATLQFYTMFVFYKYCNQTYKQLR